MIKKIILILFLLRAAVFAASVETFYGTLEVDEPVLLELIASKPMQRLKKVHQYGIAYYTTHKEEYNRFDHSLGVFAILRIKGLPLHEQIAGLLHDVSHTVFSHVGDYVFQQVSHHDAYQDDIHAWFLQKYGIEAILKKYGITVQQVLHKSGEFLALEQDLPDLCADRIDYNLQGAFYQNLLTKEEIKEIINDLQFVDNKWIGTKPHLIKKMVQFSLRMTKESWAAPDNYLMSKWLAEIMHKAINLGKISFEDIHFGEDDQIWEKLTKISDTLIETRFKQIYSVKDQFSVVENGRIDYHPKLKFRGVDPWIKVGNTLIRLTALDSDFAKDYDDVKRTIASGWAIRLKSNSQSEGETSKTKH